MMGMEADIVCGTLVKVTSFWPPPLAGLGSLTAAGVPGWGPGVVGPAGPAAPPASSSMSSIEV